MAIYTLSSLSLIEPTSKVAFFSARVIARTRNVQMAAASGATSTAAKVTPAVIVGGGRVGRALQEMGNGQDLLVKRGESVPSDFEGPILVCTRNDDLEAVLEATPKPRWNETLDEQVNSVLSSCLDSVKKMSGQFGVAVLPIGRFDLLSPNCKNAGNNLGNGMLEPWFQSKGLGDADQVLAYFAISKLGEPPIDGKTDTNPEGLTAAYGKWASAIATRLQAGGLSCKVLDKEAFQKQMLEKLIWIAAFMLVGARHPGATVGVVEKEYRSEDDEINAMKFSSPGRPELLVSSLIAELAAAASAEKRLVFDDGIGERLCAYARSVAHFPTAVKEFKWRNGWFYSISEKAIAEGKPDPCPLHTAWLRELKVV